MDSPGATLQGSAGFLREWDFNAAQNIPGIGEIRTFLLKGTDFFIRALCESDLL